jgi:hypothetical protein
MPAINPAPQKTYTNLKSAKSMQLFLKYMGGQNCQNSKTYFFGKNTVKNMRYSVYNACNQFSTPEILNIPKIKQIYAVVIEIIGWAKFA